MKYIKVFEKFKNYITLYHGTCEYNAIDLLKNGWIPNKIGQGGNMGQSQYLYVSTEPEDAQWFAEEKGCNTVLKIINIPINILKFDPEDGCADLYDYSIDVALTKLENGYKSPIKFIITKPLSNEHFIKYNLNEPISELKIYESLNKNDITGFFNDFGYFLTLNLMKIQTYATDNNAKIELSKMQNSLRSPLINGKTYAELLNDINNIINNPKFLSLFMSQIKKLIEFIEPRIIKFVIDNDYKKNWLDKIQKFKEIYKKIIS